MQELITLRGENSKTYDLGSGKRRLIIGGDIQHWKYDYSDPTEQWKECDLTIRDGRIDKAPYILEIDGKKLTFQDKKTGEVSTLELLLSKPAGMPFEIIPSNSGVSFQHILPSDKIPFEAQFKIAGKALLITRVYDDEGEIELETSLVDGILTEKLAVVKDKLTGEVRVSKGNIKVDPILTVQPSTKDTYLYQVNPDSNYGSDTSLYVYDWLAYTVRIILEFALTGLPSGVTLTSATLGLYYYSYSSTDPIGKIIWAYKQTRTDWLEYQATWNDYKAGIGWTTAGGDYVTSNPAGGSTTFPAAYGWMSWNVLAIVQNAYGSSIPAEFLVKFETEGLDSVTSIGVFYAKEYTGNTALRPKLVIEYVIPPTLKAVGQGVITPTGTLTRVRRIFKSVGTGTVTSVGVLGRIIKVGIGLGSISPTGALSSALTFFKNVGQGTVTSIGTLGRKVTLSLGAGIITPAGSLGRKIARLVGSGAITPVGILVRKSLLTVGQGIIIPAGTMTWKMLVSVGNGIITPVGTLVGHIPKYIYMTVQLLARALSKKLPARTLTVNILGRSITLKMRMK